ncbi:hypothetical protein GCM10028817_30720 [Spirosoma pomorum]
MWYVNSQYKNDKEEILKNPGFVNGVVVAKRSFKGKGVDADYYVNNIKYEASSGVSNEFFRKYSNGDSVEIVYSKKNPSKAVFKFELVLIDCNQQLVNSR